MDMYFPDGRPFHLMSFSGEASQDEHWCDPDTTASPMPSAGPTRSATPGMSTGRAKNLLLESVLRPADPEAGRVG